METRFWIRSTLKKIIPVKYRMLRYVLSEKVRYYPDLIYNLGSGLECPFCHWRFRRFIPSGFDYPVLVEKKVIGAVWRPNVICPRCKSNSRERLLYLYLKHRTTLLSGNAALLHVAPEPQLQRLLLSLRQLRYISTDLSDVPNATIMIRADITRIPFPDNTFDVILCSHVLEHIPDDRQAMRELLRVLKRGGWAILQVPIALALRETYENPAITDEEQRIREFGQRDHVRLYAMDYLDRLKAIGFSVSIFNNVKEFGADLSRLYGLDAAEDLYICSKAMDQLGRAEYLQS
jgi:SAM-dependent methyltransferase